MDVTADNGNLFLQLDNGTRRQLTSEGIDYDPALSCDGKIAVFVRRGRIPNRSVIDEELGTGDGNELWMMPVDSPGAARKIFGGYRTHADWIGLAKPQLSSDGRSVYFLRWFGNGYSMYLLSIATGDTKILVGSAYNLWPVCGGLPFSNSVVVEEDHLKLAGGHTYLYWLYDSSGRRDLVGTNEADVALFLGIPLTQLK